MLTADQRARLTMSKSERAARDTSQAFFLWLDDSDNEQRVKAVSLTITTLILLASVIYRVMS